VEVKYHDKEWLIQKYGNEKKSSLKIAKECNVSSSIILRWMKRYDIKIRNLIEAGKVRVDALPPSLYKDKKWLSNQYTTNRKTASEIADKCDVSPSTILRWMGRFGIKRRGKMESQIKERGKYMDRDWLFRKYWKENMTQYEMAKECNVCQPIIYKWMKKLNISTLGIGEGGLSTEAYRKLSDKSWLEKEYKSHNMSEIAKELGTSSTPIRHFIEKYGIKKRKIKHKGFLGKHRSEATKRKLSEIRKGTTLSEEHKKKISKGFHSDDVFEKLSDKDWMENEYKHKSSTQIADELGTTSTTICGWIKIHGLTVRSRSEAESGERHYNWKGGFFPRYYGNNWKSQRKKALKRDGYCCHECKVICGNDGKENSIHHIMPIRHFLELMLDCYDFADDINILSVVPPDILIPDVIWQEANRLDNLVTLCQKHHMKWERKPIQNLKDVSLVNGEYRFCKD